MFTFLFFIKAASVLVQSQVVPDSETDQDNDIDNEVERYSINNSLNANDFEDQVSSSQVDITVTTLTPALPPSDGNIMTKMHYISVAINIIYFESSCHKRVNYSVL